MIFANHSRAISLFGATQLHIRLRLGDRRVGGPTVAAADRVVDVGQGQLVELAAAAHGQQFGEDRLDPVLHSLVRVRRVGRDRDGDILRYGHRGLHENIIICCCNWGAN